jgi:RNA polymerase sigma-70 factor (ECF subfamily)
LVTDASVLFIEGPVTADLSSSLLVRVRSQDQVAWQRLVSLYTPLVYHWCRRAGLQAADAADVGQEVFKAVARTIAEFNKERSGGSFRRWLSVVVRTKIIDRLRRQQREVIGVGGSQAEALLQQLAEDSSTVGPSGSEADEVHLLYHRAVQLIQGEFEEATWRAFWRTAVDGIDAAQVAEELGLSRNAVYLARGRVLRRLREEFAELEDL